MFAENFEASNRKLPRKVALCNLVGNKRKRERELNVLLKYPGIDVRSSFIVNCVHICLYIYDCVVNNAGNVNEKSEWCTLKGFHIIQTNKHSFPSDWVEKDKSQVVVARKCNECSNAPNTKTPFACYFFN